MSDAVYLHVPFCRKKCSYCDFYSINALSLVSDYVESLQREIQIRSSLVQRSSPPGTIYFGGGTPSLLTLEQVEKILVTIDRCYGISNQAEITLEINPGTADQAYLAGLKTLGVNRISIGVQSFDSQKIALLDRIHRVDHSITLIEEARSAGFDNIGLDLIYGLPGESPETWITDLETALSFGPAHLSCYMLTLEQGTPLYDRFQKGLFHPQKSEARDKLFSATSLFLEQNGYEHYEISNFSRGKQNRSRHNSAYWNYTPYDGFGPSAHSFVLDKTCGQADLSLPRAVRSWNLADVRAYVATLSKGSLPLQETETLSCAQQMMEMVMLGLRTSDGLGINGFEGRFELDFLKRFGPLVTRLEAQELGRIVHGPGKAPQTKEQDKPGKWLQLTLGGRARLDHIVEAFAQEIL